METYPCTACGACCRRMGLIVKMARTAIEQGASDPLLEAYATFPFPINEQGHCAHLGEGNKCAIYDRRPAMCSIEKGWELYYRHTGLYADKQAYHQANARVCNELIKTDALGGQYLVKFPEEL